MIGIRRPDSGGSPRARHTRRRTAMLAAGVALTLACGAVCAGAFAQEQPPLLSSPGSVLVTLPWGAGDGQVGLARAREGLTRGPEALAVAPDGRIAVLDSVNHRLVLLQSDGSYAGAIRLKLREPRFLAVDDESIYVLDADADRRVAAYSWSGNALKTVDLPALENVVTGLFATTEGPCVEIAHGDTLVLAPQGNNPSQLATAAADKALGRRLAGRPLGREVREVIAASFRPQDGLRLRRQAMREPGQEPLVLEESQPVLASGRQVEHLISVDADARGRLFIGARLARPEGTGADRRSIAITSVPPSLLAATGVGSTDDQGSDGFVLLLSESDFAYLGQPYVVAPDGRIFQAVASEQGYTILVHVLAEVLP